MLSTVEKLLPLEGVPLDLYVCSHLDGLPLMELLLLGIPFLIYPFSFSPRGPFTLLCNSDSCL